MNEIYETGSTQSVRLDFAPHIKLLDTKLRQNKIVNKFRQIMSSIVRTLNLQVPAEHRLWFQASHDHITLYERIHNANESKLKKVIITIASINYFAPWIYENYQRSARILIHRKTPRNTIDTETFNKTYLVHRCFPNGDLQHPGGHLEYIETGFRYDSSKGYHLVYETGIDYVQIVLKHLLNNRSIDDLKISYEDVTDSMRRWYELGAVRETLEESGIDLVRNMTNLKLQKIGTTTFYLTMGLPTHMIVNGPSRGFEHEVVNHNQIRSGYLTPFDRFWLEKSDPLTDHAWLTASEMVKYWNPEYKDHVLELVSKAE